MKCRLASARFSNRPAHAARAMAKREHPEINLTADEHDGEPAAQRARVEEPDHLLCPITHYIFRDPVILVESGHTYERAAIERHLREDGTDPLTRARIAESPVTNRGVRKAVEAWLEANPMITPDGWDTREMLPAQPPKPPKPPKPTFDLHRAAEIGQLMDVRYWIQAGADLNAKDDEGMTPLHYSAYYAHAEIVRALIEAGADMNPKYEGSSTPLHMSADVYDVVEVPEVIRALIEGGADVNAKTDEGTTPLHFSAKNENLEVVRYLINNGADVNAKTDGGETPLQMSAKNEDLETARVLIKAGSNFDGLSIERITVLVRRML